MAHKKGAGSTKNGRDSNAKNFGVKIFGGAQAMPGDLIVTQPGLRFKPGCGVKSGSNNSLYAIRKGTVDFKCKKINGKSFFIVHLDYYKLEKRRREANIQNTIQE
jgi:large subunit ribosomal protein L27